MNLQESQHHQDRHRQHQTQVPSYLPAGHQRLPQIHERPAEFPHGQ